jgi:hypothetical protein
MYRIRRFGVRSTAVVAGMMYFVITLVGTLLFALFVAVAGADSGLGASGAAAILVGGIVIAVVYGVIGAIITAIACWIYNIVAGSVGGIQVQVETVLPPGAAPVWGPPPGTPNVPSGSFSPPPSLGSSTSASPTPSQTGWSAPPSTTDTAPYDPAAPRND